MTDSVDSSPSHFTSEQFTPEAITNTNPITVTITAHGFSNGQALRATKFYSIPFAVATGMEQLNNNLYYVQRATTNTFVLSNVNSIGIDGSNFTPFISGGQFTRTGPDLFVNNPAPDPPPPIPNPFGEP